MTSVCMATYNGGRFIKEQIDSILSELEKDDEFIISDDGSTDNTLEIIASYNDERIKLLHHKKQGNKYYPTLNLCYSTANFENALRQAKGDYIFLSDQDDIWEKGKVKACLELLKEYGYVIHNLAVIDESGNFLKKRFYEKMPVAFKVHKDILSLHFWGCCLAFRRELLDYALPFPAKVPQHDSWISLIAEKTSRCVSINEPLIRHRLSSQNTSTGGRKSRNSLFLKIRYRLNTLLELEKRYRELKKEGKIK